MPDEIPPAAIAMAEMSRHDPTIKLADIIDHAQNVTALRDWATGHPFEPEVVRALLVEAYPHLKDRP